MITNWRAMRKADIAAVSRVAACVHPAFPEDDAVFAERLALAPDGCFVLEQDVEVAGYLLSHPWLVDDIPPLNTLIGQLPVNPRTWYLHDLALLPAMRGGGRTTPLIENLISVARKAGLPSLSLVAVNASMPFWSRFGFADATTEKMREKLLSYDEEARFMVLRLPA